eukprot:scaffold2436_cov80-Skeletonema_dohrnii-CCMP3373.AAC.16
MSQFDPFASTPASGGGGVRQSSTNADNNNAAKNNPFDIFGSSTSSSNGNANNNNQGMAASLMNPFQQFTSTAQQPSQQQPPSVATSSSATAAANTSTFWQQSNAAIATAMNPSSPSSMWKSLGGASSSSLAASSSSNNASGKHHKRVVPYTGPIANLESNWDPWLHHAANNNTNNSNINTTYLIVMANQSCIVPGGVESVLKWRKLHKQNGGGKGSSMDDLVMNLDSTMSLDDGGDATQLFGGEYDSATTTSGNNGVNNEGSSSSGGNKKFGKLFKSSLKKAQASLAHSVTSIAIKADGGKNPDWVCASLHYLGGRNGDVVNRGMSSAIGGGGAMSDVCLCKTEWIPLPPPTSFGGGDLQQEEGKQLSFAVPLCVPDLSFLESAAAASSGGGDIAAENGI